MIDYCNSLYYNLPEYQLNRLRLIQNSLARAVVRAPKSSHITPSLRSLHWLKIIERIDYKILSLTKPLLLPNHLISMILSLFNHFAALVPLMLSPLLVHLLIPLWKSTIALSTMPHLVSGMNFPQNFANLSMMSPCHCHLIFLSPIHHRHHHHHHFHYASLHLCSTPNSKLVFSINPSLHSLPHLFGFLWPFRDLIAHRFFFCFALFILFLFDSCDRLSWFHQLLNCTYALSFPFLPIS